MKTLQNISDAFAAVAESAGHSVIGVNARRRFPASGIVWSGDGVIVSAHHVIQRDENISVVLPDGETAPATLVGRDPTTDLAVLRADASNLTPATWVGLDIVKVGHLVMALGRPIRDIQASLGVVRAIGETMHFSGHNHRHSSRRGPTAVIHRGNYLRPDLVMYPGFSGGPLVDASGKVIGMNTSALFRGALTIPCDIINSVVETLLKHGRMRQGFLGIGSQPARIPEVLVSELEQEIGLLIVSVEAGSPAERGGLLVGDIIVAFDGEPIRTPDELLFMLSGDRAGHEVPVRVARGGQLQEVAVVVSERV